ncbi:MAG: hypothetical protein J0H64_04395 [Actinobacteria bacterium]|nr:hypothetical protein [Actinomycetota bacterium]
MKTIARIAATASAAVAATLVSVLASAPAFANEGGPKIDPTAEFSSAGEPLQVGAILICGFVLLAVVLLTAQAISAPFEKK